ncbi:cephalosporin hydroxylase family protein [Nitrincola sp. MINF-07-Sa-05]|uniref:cephalosporin hydroxylase family protein n=1 Tax=Nitrincola salilacus TaxID=3400273 RepID=UPI003918497E
MDQIELFQQQVQQNIERLANDTSLHKLSLEWILKAGTVGAYAYNFQWLGRPIIQCPQDMVAMQELIWQIKPDLIIETGIAHGGSLIMNASLLALLDICDAIEADTTLNPAKSERKVLGIDIDIRAHNRTAIEAHPMSSRIQMIEGSSIAPEVVEQVHTIAKDYKCILVCLDSNHTHDHVLAELKMYAPLVSQGSYCIVFDTLIEDMPDSTFPDRPWGSANNPKTAVREYLKNNQEFEIDKNVQNKLLITVAPDGYLRRK